MSRLGKVTRRAFLVGSVAVAGGVAFGVYAARKPAPNPLAPEPGEVALNPYLMIDGDGVTVIVPKAEMGQGVRTTWAALLAEELDIEPADLRIEHGPPGKAYYNRGMGGQMIPEAHYRQSNFQQMLGEQMAVMGKFLNLQVTGGSTSTIDGFDKMRHAGASARETLKEAAAQRLGVDRSRLKTEGGAVIAPDGSRLPYTELATAAGEIDPIVVSELRPRESWRYLGRTQPRHDQPGKATGTAEFSIDVRVPGMKYAALRRNPGQGGAMRGFDPAPAMEVPGVEKVVDLGDGIAVVANNSWSAMRGAEAVEVDWADAPYPKETAAIFDTIARSMEGEANSALLDRGDADTLPEGATEVTAEYRVPYLSHAQMEPLNATAIHHGDRMEIWSGNQLPYHSREVAAEEAGLSAEAVELHTTMMGGAFGRRGFLDFTRYAARLAAQMQGTPVQLLWSREEDMTHGYYRPGAIGAFRGAVKDGRAVLLDGQIAGQSATARYIEGLMGFAPPGPDKGHVEGAFDQPYAIPNARIRGYLAEMNLPTGFWRSVGASVNGFFFDSFLDEMAHAADADPLAFRLEMMREEDPRSAAVLEAVGEISGWTGKTPDGVGRGVAFCHSFGTPVAEVLELHRTDEGIRVAKAWIACDPGIALDPGNIEAQMSGGLAYGLSAALYQKITFADGVAEQRNFPDYDAVRMHTMPKDVQVRILESGHLSGVGEPAVPPAAAALANALYDLTGERARQLPLADSYDFVW